MTTRSQLLRAAMILSGTVACAAATGSRRDVASTRHLTDPSTGMTMVHVAGGCYQMGASKDDCDATPEERPLHEVCVDDFFIGQHEVTRGQWRSIIGGDPPASPSCGGERCPITGVSFQDVQEFLRRLNARTGSGSFRLPTEAEWEYAARSGGRAEPFSGGNEPGKYSWHADNSGGANHPVGAKAANGLGLHDMSGNVWEMTGDWYDPTFYANSPRDNPSGPGAGEDHVVRGGCRSSRLPNHRATRRTTIGERTQGTGRGDNVGFRLVFRDARPSTPGAVRP